MVRWLSTSSRNFGIATSSALIGWLLFSHNKAVAPFSSAPKVLFQSQDVGSRFSLVLAGRSIPTQDVEGLMSDQVFEVFDSYDEMLFLFKSHLTNLLVLPLTIENAAKLYDVNFRFFVGNETSTPLVSGLNELVAIVLALRTVVSGGSIASFPSLGRVGSDEIPANLFVHSKMAYNPESISESMDLCVVWNFNLPLLMSRQTAESSLRICGQSVVKLAPRVKEHRLITLEINGAMIDTSTIGDWLASIRRTIVTMQKLISVPLPPDFNPGGLLARQSADLPVAGSGDEANLNSMFFYMASAASFRDWVPMDHWNGPNPIPGSSQWASYRQTHIAVSAFVRDILPKLVDGTVSEREFCIDADFVGMDKTMLLQGATKLSRLYSALALLRRSSAAELSIQKTSIVDSNLGILVEYAGQIHFPVPMEMKGKDRFSISLKGKDVIIESIVQESLDFGEYTGLVDGVWFTRQVIASIEAGKPLNWLTAKLLVESSADRDRLIAPKRSERAEANIFRMMEALHRDFGHLLNPHAPSPDPPVSSFLSDTIKLRGYMGEVLLDGRSSYIQSLRLLIKSVRGAITSAVLNCNVTSVRVELTVQGRVRCVVFFSVRISEAMWAFPGHLDNARIELSTEYQPNNSSGMIDEHLLCDCRINGVLTPADVVARILRNRPSMGEEDWISIALRSFKWRNSIGGRNNPTD